LSQWPDAPDAWLVHFHHGSFAWMQWFGSSGRLALAELVCAFHEVLTGDKDVANVTWYHERDMRTADPSGAARPRGV
jgi:hypothetical protein